MDIFISNFGYSLKKEDNHFLIKGDDSCEKIIPEKVKSFIISEYCSISTNAINLAVQNNIPIYITNNYGDITAKIWNPNYNSAAILQIRQLKVFSSCYGNNFGRKWILTKIAMQEQHLKELYGRRKLPFTDIQNKFKIINDKIKNIDFKIKNFSQVIMGYEGQASHLYFSSINSLLPNTWKFKKRVNKGATDPYNIILNYCFGILYTKVETALTIRGLNVYVGVLHSSSKKQKSLVFDYIETFRHIAYRATFSLFSQKKVTKKMFQKDTFLLTKEAKITIANEFYKHFYKPKKGYGRTFTRETALAFNISNLVQELMENEIYNSL